MPSSGVPFIDPIPQLRLSRARIVGSHIMRRGLASPTSCSFRLEKALMFQIPSLAC
jgi:hypothetical protein